MTLGKVFDPRNNALNAWRLILATGVILWHSWPLGGYEVDYMPVVRLMSEVWVDGFFAISGFLITASWLRNPRLRDYWTARVLRIFPGLWVCVVITAFVIAPLAMVLQGHSVANLMSSTAPFEYVLNNGVLNAYYAGIDGTPQNVPHAGVWNGSLWTLAFEMFCYIAVSVLGVIGLLKRRWTIPILFVLALSWSAYVSYPTNAMQTWPQMLARFAVMFAAGALLHRYKDSIPARWSLVAVGLAIVIASAGLANYRVVAALPLAYAIIASGALLKSRRLNLKTDISYGVYIYAFPIQQLLVIIGVAKFGPVALFVAAAAITVPLAALSWFVVEKPAMTLKSRFKGKQVATSGPAAGSLPASPAADPPTSATATQDASAGSPLREAEALPDSTV